MTHTRILEKQIKSNIPIPRPFQRLSQPDPIWLAVMDPEVDGKRLENLAQGAPESLLERIAEHPNASERLLRKLAEHTSAVVRGAVTENAHVTESLILLLSCDQHPDVRFRIAENAQAPLSALKQLVNDENPYVAHRAAKTLNRINERPALVSGIQIEAGSGLFISMRGTPEGRERKSEERQVVPFMPMANKRTAQARQVPGAEKQKLRILVIEDNPADVRLLEKALSKWPFDLVCVDRLSEGLKHLSSQPADVILLDLSLPDAQGIETFYLVHCQAPHVPVVVLTGLEDEAIGNEAVQLGAQDYLVKGQVTPNLLARAIKYAVERHESESKIKDLNESLERRVLQLASANQDLEHLTEAMVNSSTQARDLLDRLSKVMYKESSQLELKKLEQQALVIKETANEKSIRIRKNKS